jgi:hypothetical protein
VLLTNIVVAGLDAALSSALAPWRKPLAVLDPGKVILDLALTLALGGDCLATSHCCAPSPASTVRCPRQVASRTEWCPAPSLASPVPNRIRPCVRIAGSKVTQEGSDRFIDDWCR